jgi:DEAD/DEAH box helicase domain-containing protein
MTEMADFLEVVFDIETKEAKRDGIWMKTLDMEVSVVSAFRSDTNTFETYWENELGRLEELFSKADRIVGFNSWSFDEPILQKYMKLNLLELRSIDLLEAVRKAIGTRVKLDLLAKATLGHGKSASGLDAVEYWRNGELDKLAAYCQQDVEVTKDLYYRGKETGKISYINGLDEKIDFNIRWEDGERIPTAKDTSQQSMF